MKKLMEYIFLTNPENKWVFGIVGLFIIAGFAFSHIDGHVGAFYYSFWYGFQENKIWIYWTSFIWLFWFAANAIKYYVDKSKN